MKQYTINEVDLQALKDAFDDMQPLPWFESARLARTRKKAMDIISSLSQNEAKVSEDDHKARLVLLDDAWRALKIAMMICDAVPTRAQYAEGPLKHIGELVNGKADPTANFCGGYHAIRKALNAVDSYLKTVPAEPDPCAGQAATLTRSDT